MEQNKESKEKVNQDSNKGYLSLKPEARGGSIIII
jgi:hypothetical protein